MEQAISLDKQPQEIIPSVGIAVCASLLGDLALFAVLATQTDQTGLTLAQIGVLLSIHRFIRLPANPLAGVLADRWGRRKVFILGLILAALSTAGYGVVHGFWLFLLCRLAWGCAWALINTGGLNILLDLSGPSNRGKLSGAYNLWIWAGYALGPSIGGFLVDEIQFKWAMLCLAGLTTIGLFVAISSVPETNTLQMVRTQKTETAKTDYRLRLQLILHNPHLWLSFLLYALTRFTGDGIILSTLSLFIAQRLGDSVQMGGWVIGVATIGGVALASYSVLAAISGGPAGKVSDGKWGRLPVIILSLGVGVIGFALMGYVQTVWGLVLGIILSAVSGGAVVSALVAYMGDQATNSEQGMIMGLFATAGDVGSMLGPVMALSLTESINLSNIYLFSLGIYLFGMIIAGLRLKLDSVPEISKAHG